MKVVIFSITLALFVSFLAAQTAANPQPVVLLDTALIIDNHIPPVDTVQYFLPKSLPIPDRREMVRPKGGELWRVIREFLITE